LTPYEYIEQNNVVVSDEVLERMRTHEWVEAERNDNDWFFDVKWICPRCRAYVGLSPGGAIKSKCCECNRRLMQQALE
jgi:hypothetical protein